jgi:hypothetical protein
MQQMEFELGTLRSKPRRATTQPCNNAWIEDHTAPLSTSGILNSKFSKKIGKICSVCLYAEGARETRLPVGNQIYRPVTKTSSHTFVQILCCNHEATRQRRRPGSPRPSPRIEPSDRTAVGAPEEHQGGGVVKETRCRSPRRRLQAGILRKIGFVKGQQMGGSTPRNW